MKTCGDCIHFDARTFMCCGLPEKSPEWTKTARADLLRTLNPEYSAQACEAFKQGFEDCGGDR